MATLTLLRHAKSSWDDPTLPDSERPLNPRGRAAAAEMAGRLQRAGYCPDTLLVSDAVRTRETARAIMAVYKQSPQLIVEPQLYDASVQTVLAVIQNAPPTAEHLMVIGHNPSMETLAAILGGTFRRFPTAAYLRVAIGVPWKRFAAEACEVLAYDFPKSGNKGHL